MFLSCIEESRDFTTCYIPGLFMQAEMEEMIFVQISGPPTTILAQFDQNRHEKYIVYEKGIPVIYMRL